MYEQETITKMHYKFYLTILLHADTKRKLNETNLTD